MMYECHPDSSFIEVVNFYFCANLAQYYRLEKWESNALQLWNFSSKIFHMQKIM